MNSYYDCENYSVNLPYPSVVIYEQNTYYASLLSDAFAGPGSETTALTQYTAHNFYTLCYPEITNAYKCILSVEYIHLNLLGNLIRDLGLHPIFMTYQTMQYWSGSFPEYASDIKQILLADIAGENAAIAHYTQLISQINNPDIQALISRIILDEKKHVEILTSFYCRLSEDSLGCQY
jgi:bacterioferritin